MLKGIDISNWQGDMTNPAKLKVDFCICKATEGLDFIDPFCNAWIQKLITGKKLFGYYHFARKSNPKAQAKYFWNNTLGYNCMGIPVLDYEIWYENQNHVAWCETFLQQYHKLSGIWPVLYISASHCQDFTGSWIPEKCGLWVAGYPHYYDNWPVEDDMTYDVAPWKFAAIWQFTSSFKISGYKELIDADVAFMDSNAWLKYAGNKTTAEPAMKTPAKKTCEQLADEVIEGKWGDGWNRKQALDSAYGNGTYDHVQMIVNDKVGLDGC